MKAIKKLIFLTISLLFCQISMVASTNSHLVSTDTIPSTIKKYKGNRIEVKSIKVTKKRSKTVKIEYNLSNSGRNKIKLGKGKNIPDDLIVLFDKSLEENGLSASKEAIIEKLKKESISIRPGQLIMKNKLKFEFIPIPPTDRIVKEEINQNISIDTLNEIETVIAPKPRKRKTQPIPEFVFPEFETEILDETILTNDEKDKEIKESKSLPSFPAEVIIKKEDIVKTERKKINLPPTLPTLKVYFLTTSPNFDFRYYASDDYLKQINIEENINDSTILVEAESKVMERKCADLILEKVEITKKTKRNVTVQITLKNIGNAPIKLKGERKKDDGNMAITAHFTRSEKLTRGSIPIKIFYLKKGLKAINYTLEPGQSFSQKLKIETYKMTKFTPVLALSVDPLQVVAECTKVNNVSFINIAENAAPSPMDALPIKPTIESTGEETIGANGMKE